MNNDKRTIGEVSRLAGVSVRSLRHYDAIGLLRPSEVTEAGYRLYDAADLQRLQQILLFRELQFPLREIRAILDAPAFDPREALSEQIRLLELQRQRIERLISFAREVQERGIEEMDFQVFDRTEFNQYEQEVKERWGGTEAYAQYQERCGSGGASSEAVEGLMRIFSEFGALCALSPDAKPVQAKVRALQEYITQNFYPCTGEILRGLGGMYVLDERMKANIDRAGGEGCAEFVSRAIAVCCGEER